MSREATNLFCPNCKLVHPCEITDYQEAKDYAGHKPSGLRRFMADYPDIAWFARVRRCGGCNEIFVTAEVHDRLVEELARRRDEVKKLQEDLRLYKDAVKAARDASGKLSETLAKLPDK